MKKGERLEIDRSTVVELVKQEAQRNDEFNPSKGCFFYSKLGCEEPSTDMLCIDEEAGNVELIFVQV